MIFVQYRKKAAARAELMLWEVINTDFKKGEEGRIVGYGRTKANAIPLGIDAAQKAFTELRIKDTKGIVKQSIFYK